MRLFIHHRTGYRFSEPQARIVQLLRLTPGSHVGQNVVDWGIDVDCNARLRRGRDGFGNETTMLYVDGPIDRLALTVTGEVLTEDRAGMVTGTLELLPFPLYLRTTACTRLSPEIAAFIDEIGAGGGSLLDKAHRLNDALAERLRFDEGRRRDARDAATVFEEGHGAFQDLAHVFIACARGLGLPARYVSGHRLPSEGGDILRDAAHGWAEVHAGDFGWIGFDPSCGRCPDERYVRVAMGLDYKDAAPLSGTRTGGGEEELEVGVRVGLSQAQA